MNVGSGIGTTIKEVATMLFKTSKTSKTLKDDNQVNLQIILGEKRVKDPAILIANINKAKKLIGFEPSFDLRQFCYSIYN